MSVVRTMQMLTGADLVTGGAFTQVAGAAVTQANMRLSAVDGTAFVDFSTADLLTDHLGKILTVKDSAGKVLVGYIKAAGSGETYTTLIGGDTLNGNMETGDPPTGWNAGGGATLSSVADERDGGAGSASLNIVRGTTDSSAYQAPGVSAGQLIYLSGWAKNIDITTQVNIGFSSLAVVWQDLVAWKNGTGYRTATAAHSIAIYLVGSAGQQGRVDDISVKQVLTPASTGVTIVSTPGGSTYNWTYQESGFNYNDASNYTYEIYDTDFTYGTGWYPSSNTAVKVAGTASALEQNISARPGKDYTLVWTNDQSTTAKAVNAEIGGVDGLTVTVDATTTETIKATGTGNLKIEAAADWAGNVDAIACTGFNQYHSRERRR